MISNFFKLPRSKDKYILLDPVNVRYTVIEGGEALGICRKQAPKVKEHPRVKGIITTSSPAITLVILLTNACNMRCSFCYLEGEYTETVITMDVLKKALSDYIADGTIIRGVFFIGGEPTLEMDAMADVIEYLDTTYPSVPGHKIQYGLTTNGTLLSNEFRGVTIAKWLVDNSIDISISLEGPKEIHDVVRKHGYSTFDAIMAGQDIILQNGGSIRYRATFEPDDRTIIDRLEFFSTLPSRTRLDLVSNTNREYSKEVEEIMQESFLDAADWSIKTMKNDGIGWRYLIKVVRQILSGQEKLNGCASGGPTTITIDANGDRLGCHRRTGCLIDNKEKLDWWNSTAQLYEAHCQKCTIRHLCGGGCRAIRLTNGTHHDLPTKYECSVNVAMVKTAFYLIENYGEEELREHLHKFT